MNRLKEFKALLMLPLLALTLVQCTSGGKVEKKSAREVGTKPNIVVIYTDDLGYGDLSCYGSKDIITPNIDRIAAEGVKFTNGYCTSATCTPSRYSLLTGEYPWRNKRARVLSGDAKILIEPGMTTLPSMLQKAGYYTGIVGKWHLGLGNGSIDWNSEVKPGPRAVGFDYEFIMAATNDRTPTVYLENGDVLRLDKSDPIEVSYKKNFEGEPTALTNPEMVRVQWSHGHNNSIVNGVGRIGFMKGGESAKWVDENMADTFLVRAQNFLVEHKDEPFFLYYALHQPHAPRIPHPRFIGSTKLGPRGDVIVEADWCIGEFMKSLKELGLDDNTIVIFSSDNGPVLDDGYVDGSDTMIGDHDQLGGLRGGKYSLFDGGTRVPFMVRWPGVVEPKESDALVCQVDFLASFASMLGVDSELHDSENIMDALLGKSDIGRDNIVLQANGVMYRSGDWALIPPREGAKIVTWGVNNETGNDMEMQLYNLTNDKGQKNNVASENPEIVARLSAELKAITDNR